MARKDRVFQFIVTYKREHDGISPTLREIVEAGLASSTSHAKDVLITLYGDGRIDFAKGSAPRAIMVVGGRWDYDD